MTASAVRYIGDDWPFAFTYKDPAGNPINLTGFTPSAMLFPPFNATAVSLTVQNQGAVVVDAAAGRFRFVVSDAITALFKASDRGGRLQIMMTDSLGNLTTLGVLPIDVRAP